MRRHSSVTDASADDQRVGDHGPGLVVAPQALETSPTRAISAEQHPVAPHPSSARPAPAARPTADAPLPGSRAQRRRRRRRRGSAERTSTGPAIRPGPARAPRPMWRARRVATIGRRPPTHATWRTSMLSQTLYRLGGFAARRPWAVIGAWLVLAVVVVGASGAFGAKLEDSFRVPGLDSQAGQRPARGRRLRAGRAHRAGRRDPVRRRRRSSTRRRERWPRSPMRRARDCRRTRPSRTLLR